MPGVEGVPGLFQIEEGPVQDLIAVLQRLQFSAAFFIFGSGFPGLGKPSLKGLEGMSVFFGRE